MAAALRWRFFVLPLERGCDPSKRLSSFWSDSILSLSSAARRSCCADKLMIAGSIPKELRTPEP